MEDIGRYIKVCVTGGSGYLGSYLIKKLLDKGHYIVHATLRNLGESAKVGLLKSLPGAESRLQLFEADIYNAEQFEPAIRDCQCVFHLATPYVHSQNSKNYTASKTQSEKEVLSFDKVGDLEVVSLALGLVGGDTLLPYVSGSISAIVSLLTDHDKESAAPSSYEALRFVEELCAKIPLIHIEDACQAFLFCMEKAGMSGRFLCSSHYVSSAEIAQHYKQNYPEHEIKQPCTNLPKRSIRCADLPKRSIRWGSTKLIDEGFKYNCDLKFVLDDSVKCAMRLNAISIDASSYFSFKIS